MKKGEESANERDVRRKEGYGKRKEKEKLEIMLKQERRSRVIVNREKKKCDGRR